MPLGRPLALWFWSVRMIAWGSAGPSAHDNQSRSIDKVIDMFKGYPKGTTMGEILSGKAQKILTPVETTDESKGQ